jgi:hypothetical protein
MAMDLTAPFLFDMGLGVEGAESLRSVFQAMIDQDPSILVTGGALSDKIKWLEELEALFRRSVPDQLRQHFWTWLRNTYTFVPADRPNWEMYEMFFFVWSVGMRDGGDTAKCFTDPASVCEMYHAFVSSRQLKARIKQARRTTLSSWDHRIFSLCGYSLSEDEIDCDTIFDPFGVVDATANRNYFQFFFEHLLRRLPPQDIESLFWAVRRYDDSLNSRLPDLVRPTELRRDVR